MNFLKNFFNDDSTIIGLCSFDKNRGEYCNKTIINEVLFNNVSFEKTFETNFSRNALLF